MQSTDRAILAVLLAFASLQGSATAAGAAEGARVQLLTRDGGHLDWCHGNGVVAFDRRGPGGYFDVWLMDAEGRNERPLTTRTPGLPRRHVGDPAWHPSCRYLVVQAQQANSPRRIDDVAVPGSGVLNDLWVVSADGARAWKLLAVSSKVDKNAEGVLHPHFSHDGRRLLWSQRVGAGPTSFGAWVMKLADFEIGPGGEPRLGEIRTLAPGGKPAFFETHGFSPDDRSIIYSGNPDAGMEIYTLDLASGRVQRLTNSPRAWDEHAHFSPDGGTIAWMSSEGLRFEMNPFQLEAEFWLMDSGGGNKRRLTYFHEPGHRHHIFDGDFVVAADLAWAADGKSFIGLVITGRPGTPKRGTGPIVRVTLP